MGLIQVDCNKLFRGDSFIESLRFNNLPCKEVKILSDNIQEELDLLAECSVRTPEHTHSSEQRLFLSCVVFKVSHPFSGVRCANPPLCLSFSVAVY